MLRSVRVAAALCVVVASCTLGAVGCGGQDTREKASATQVPASESSDRSDTASDDDAEITFEPTSDGKQMDFGIVPSEWGPPGDLNTREAALGLPDETGAFWFMVSLRKTRVGDATHADLREYMHAVFASVGEQGLRAAPARFSKATAMGLEDCERMDAEMEVTEPGGRFEVGDVMRSSAWNCLEDGILYSVSTLEMTEPDAVIREDLRRIVAGVTLREPE